MMTAAEFFAEWSTKYSNLELTVRDVAGSFPISVQAATKMLQAFVKEGKAKRHITQHRELRFIP